MKRKIFMVMMVLLLVVSLGSTVYAGNDVGGIVDSVTSSGDGGTFGDLGDTIAELMGDTFFLVRMMSVGILVIFAIIAFSRYGAAADNPTEQAKQKKIVIGIVIAILGIVNINNIMNLIAGITI